MTSEFVTHCLHELKTGDAENAWFRLIEAGTEAVPDLVEAFRNEPNSDMRATLVEIIWQCRSLEIVPFLAEALDDPAPNVWKAALDGLVAEGGPESVRVLEEAVVRSESRPELVDWAREALQQILASHQ